MKTALALFLTLAPTTSALAQSPARQACNAVVDVTDTDPKSTNVRSEPGGSVLATLEKSTDNGWIIVHLTAQIGDWYEIDRASLIDANLPLSDTSLFQGKGYLHKSVVGVSGIQNGGFVYRNHNIRSDLIDPHAEGDQRVELLGCWGEFLKVRVKKGIGWTTQACTNMNTTCA